MLSASKQLGLSLLCSPDHRARKVCPNRLGACTLPLRINCSACTDLPNGFEIEQAVVSWRRPYSSYHYLGSSPGRSITAKKLCFLPLFFKVFQHSEISPYLGADTGIWKTVVCIFRIDHGKELSRSSVIRRPSSFIQMKPNLSLELYLDRCNETTLWGLPERSRPPTMFQFPVEEMSARYSIGPIFLRPFLYTTITLKFHSLLAFGRIVDNEQYSKQWLRDAIWITC